jgi:Cft2 family RNA processing exonuclease
MKLTDLNRQGGIGANSLLVELGGCRILVDCGLNPKLAGRAATPDLARLAGPPLDLIIITHCHLDHIGSLPLVMRDQPNTPVLMSQSSRIIIERMMHNSASVMVRQQEEGQLDEPPLFSHNDIDRLASRFVGVPFLQPKRFYGRGGEELTVILHPAGHVAGAAAVEVRHKHRGIFFTGDVLFDDQRTLPGAKFPAGHFDTVVTETTRGATERPVGKERGREIDRLITSINDTIARGGSFLMPIFALGRMQEILAVMHDARKFDRLVDCPIFASGLGMDLADYFHDISRKTGHVNFNRGILKELQLKPLPRKLTPGQDAKQNALYIVSSGMLVENTPSYTLASGLLSHARNTLGFVGYCDPDTPGGKLLAAKPGEDFLFEKAHVRAKVKARIERFELSGHADREELVEFVHQATPRAVVLTHGDPEARAWFAQRFAELAPDLKVLDPTPLEAYQV